MNKYIRTLLYRLNYYKFRKARPYGLNLGSSGIRIPKFINVDADWKTDCDIVSLIDDLKYGNGSVNYIYNSHVLEHVSWRYKTKSINEWLRVLVPGGKLYICVPNLEKLATIYLDGLKDYENKRETTDLACNIIYGGQKDKWDFHGSGYSFTTLKKLLEEAGFKDVQLFNHSDVEMLKDVKDAGSAAQILGESISLNVVATK